jgi:hypothetical protein
MGHAVAILAVLLAMLLAAAFLLGRHLSRRQFLRDELSPVSRQHIDLFQGGHLSEAAVESAKSRYRELLERGDLAGIEASLRPGMLYVVNVHALAELGTDAAGRILERQLQRRLTEDQIEQAWYWIDLAKCLRALNRSQSLPVLLRCAETACERPLGHFFAAETVCFLGFNSYLTQPPRLGLGHASRVVLHRAMEGLRCGVAPQVVAEARLGEMIENLWDERSEEPDPLAARIFQEAIRVLRRAPHAETAMGIEAAEQEAFNWQMARLAGLEDALVEYLADCPAALKKRLAAARPNEQRDLLLALNDLHAEAGPEVLALLVGGNCEHPALAFEVLTWSKDPRVGTWLREWTANKVSLVRRAQKRRRSISPSRPSVSAEIPYREALRALRGHPAQKTETFLMLAARDWDPAYRAAALSSLGWWEPVERTEVLLTLQDGRRDPNPEVRQYSRAALARLGERQALQWFRQTLASEDPQRVHETIQFVANEAIMLLWPDLDRLADAEDIDIAHHAREALERLCEELDRCRS